MKECATEYIIIPTEGNLISVPSSLKKAVEIGQKNFNDDFIIRVMKRGKLNDWYETGDVYNSKGIMIAKKGQML